MKKKEVDYYVHLDYSERLVGYIIIENSRVPDILHKITKFHHYKDIKYRKAYIQSIKNVFNKNKIKEYLLKYKIVDLKDNLSVFVDVIDFINKNHHRKIFVSIDDNQFDAFSKLVNIVYKENITIVKESNLKKGSVEYRISLIIDTMLNIGRLSKQTRQTY